MDDVTQSWDDEAYIQEEYTMFQMKESIHPRRMHQLLHQIKLICGIRD